MLEIYVSISVFKRIWSSISYFRGKNAFTQDYIDYHSNSVNKKNGVPNKGILRGLIKHLL